jgi:hypothetical protein
LAPNQQNTYFCMERGIRTMNWVQVFVHKRLISTFKRADSVTDRMSYIILRGRWFHIIVLNVNASNRG